MSAFDGKNYWALILGGSSGIGLAAAKKLAKEGMNLILVYRERRSREEEVKQEFAAIEASGNTVLHFNADATNAEKIEVLITEIASKIGEGRIRVLLHSIAKGNLKTMTEPPADSDVNYPPNRLGVTDFTLTSESMAFSILPWTNALLEQGLFAAKSRVIALTSAGDYRVWKGYAAVAAAKSALESIIKYIAIEYAHKGINANLIEAGVTVTPSMQLIPGSEKIITDLEQKHPKGGLTQPEYIADTIYLLCLEEANWINGARLKADGGEHLI